MKTLFIILLGLVGCAFLMSYDPIDEPEPAVEQQLEPAPTWDPENPPTSGLRGRGGM